MRNAPLPSSPCDRTPSTSRAGTVRRAHPSRRSEAPGARSGTCDPPSSRSMTLRSASKMLPTKSSSSFAKSSTRSGVKSGNRFGSGSTSVEAVHVEPLEREVRHQRVRARIGQHAAHLRVRALRARAACRVRCEVDERRRPARGSTGRTRAAKRDPVADAERLAGLRVARAANARDTGISGSRGSPSAPSECRCRSPPCSRPCL